MPCEVDCSSLVSVCVNAAGSSASVTNVGTSSAAKFNFVIPKGDKGDPGATGATGPKGATGAAGKDGLTTSVTVNGTKYTHSSGNITLPNYPTLSSLGAAASSHSHSTASTSAAGFLRQLNGSTSQYLRGDGSWATPPNTTYSNMTGATSSAAGKAGLVPAPAAGKQTSFLRGDGTWVVPTNTTYGLASTTANGLLKQLSGSTSQFMRGDGSWATPPNTNTTYTLTKSGSTITLTGSDGKTTSVTDSNTTYSLSSFGITATAAELNKLDGCTATVTELNYCDGVTSNIQSQLNGKAASSHSHSVATTSANGFMSSTDKTTLNNMKAYITASGTSGVWRYLKYSDGWFECWTVSPYRYSDNAYVDQTFGAVKNSQYFDPPNLPFTIISAPLYNYNYYSADPGTQHNAWLIIQHNQDGTKLPGFAFIYPSDVTIGHPQMMFWVRGRYF